MKNKYILLLLVLAFVSFSFKERRQPVVINWYNWNDGYLAAKQNKKLILVDIYTNWCGWCKKMDRDVFTDPDVSKLLTDNFINVKLNPERTDMSYSIDTLNLNGYQMYNLLTNGQRSGFPTIVVVDPVKNQVLHADAGYMSAQEFSKTIQQVIGQYKKQ